MNERTAEQIDAGVEHRLRGFYRRRNSGRGFRRNSARRTFRCAWAHLARRSRSLAGWQATLVAGMYLVGATNNFCRPHESLRQEVPSAGRRWRERTPAMAAGLADHAWTMAELLWWRPLAATTPPEG